MALDGCGGDGVHRRRLVGARVSFHYAPDRHIEAANYSQRRMRQEFKQLHAIAVKLGAEMRDYCAPPDVRSDMGKIVDQIPRAGAQGGPTPDASPEETALGLCVAKVLRPIERAVYDSEYVWCFGKDIGEKLCWLKKWRHIDMSRTQYKHKLMILRERLLASYQVVFENIF
jgi:hypothetical protein